MRRLTSTALAVLAAASMTIAAGQQSSTPAGYTDSASVAKGETLTIDGASDTGGSHLTYGGVGTLGLTEDEFVAEIECSPGSYQAYCDLFLIEFTDNGAAVLDLAGNQPGVDFDLRVFSSDADGTKGNEVANSGNLPGEAENAAVGVPEPGFYRVEVIYYLAGGGYTLDIALR